jgi:hypothetical protein
MRGSLPEKVSLLTLPAKPCVNRLLSTNLSNLGGCLRRVYPHHIIHPADLLLSCHCHLCGLKISKGSKRGINMNDHMFVETLIISSTFFTIAMILVASVMFLEKHD